MNTTWWTREACIIRIGMHPTRNDMKMERNGILAIQHLHAQGSYSGHDQSMQQEIRNSRNLGTSSSLQSNGRSTPLTERSLKINREETRILPVYNSLGFQRARVYNNIMLGKLIVENAYSWSAGAPSEFTMKKPLHLQYACLATFVLCSSVETVKFPVLRLCFPLSFLF